jgi:hypothetical protein
LNIPPLLSLILGNKFKQYARILLKKEMEKVRKGENREVENYKYFVDYR